MTWLRFNPWTWGAVVVALTLALPVMVIAGLALVPAGDTWAHLVDTVLWGYIANTGWLVLGVGSLTLIIGVGCAWLVTLCRFPGRRFFEWALFLPMAMPAYVMAYTYTGMLEYAGPAQTLLRDAFGWGRHDYWFPDIRSVGGAIAMLSLVLYPYVYLLARSAFLEQSVCVIEVARTLGCSARTAFLRVALPLARPAIVTGVALALMETLGDFGTVQYFAVDTFTTGIFRTWLALGDVRAAGQLSAMLVAMVMLLLWLERRSRGGARYHHTSSRYRPLPRFKLTGWGKYGAVAACVLPLALGFLVPAGQMLVWAAETYQTAFDARFLGLVLNSLGVAALAAVLAVVLGLFLAYGLRLHANPLAVAATRTAAMGYAIPGAVVAVGVLVPFAWADNALDAWMREAFGISTGLILSGTLAALIFAYLVRFLAVSFNAVDSGLSKITQNMDYAARTLGRGPLATVFLVHIPLLRGSLMTAALLVFVDVMKELPATLIMRPFNFNTLAVRAFELASDEQLAETAIPALAIVAAGLIPVILLSRAISASRPGRMEA